MNTAMSASNVRLNARVQGLGPFFRVVIDIQNTGKETMLQTPLIAHFDTRLYRIKQALYIIPLLVPGLLYHICMDVESIEENGAAGDIYLLLSSMDSAVPMISAVVSMPLSEIPADD